VGKTSILLRYVKNAFDERQISTISASCFDKQVPIGGGEVSCRMRGRNDGRAEGKDGAAGRRWMSRRDTGRMMDAPAV
jgi:hypothetical protein